MIEREAIKKWKSGKQCTGFSQLRLQKELAVATIFYVNIMHFLPAVPNSTQCQSFPSISTKHHKKNMPITTSIYLLILKRTWPGAACETIPHAEPFP